MKVLLSSASALAFLASHAPAHSGSAQAPDRLVAAAYFYWYRWPEEHFDEPGAPGPEGHLHHFPGPQKVSYLDPAWHEAQFREMAECGIDVALPVYWGAPGAYERGPIRFSRAGIGPMVEALRKFARSGGKAPTLGLFYDTSTLEGAARGRPEAGRADLTTSEGKSLFCGTVVDYFAEIPKEHWARFEGGAIVVLYVSAFAARWEKNLGATLREAFAERFPGERVFLVTDRSWGEIGQDRTTSWGAALEGPRLFPGVAQIGPGYDDSQVPGRRTPLREREDGNFYRASWREAILSEARLVILETWNEMHEGTEICETKETGRFYLDLTREWAARFKRGEDPGPEIPLAWKHPRPRPDLSWGAEAEGAPEVRVDYSKSPPERFGLREIGWEDGPLEIREGALRPGASPAGPGRYLYFQVSDSWKFDTREDLVVLVTPQDDTELGLEYDSWIEAAPLNGAYARAAAERQRALEGTTFFRIFRLPSARFADRQNCGGDFRLVVPDGAAILSVRVLPGVASNRRIRRKRGSSPGRG